MLMIDVDNFKSYNDTYGHVRGDDVLKRVAAAIQNVANRPADLTARFGGEEFAIVLPGAPAGGVRLLAERVRQEIEQLGLPQYRLDDRPDAHDQRRRREPHTRARRSRERARRDRRPRALSREARRPQRVVVA